MSFAKKEVMNCQHKKGMLVGSTIKSTVKEGIEEEEIEEETKEEIESSGACNTFLPYLCGNVEEGSSLLRRASTSVALSQENRYHL